MNDYAQVIDGLKHALEQVLYVQVEQMAVGDGERLPSEERWVAAIEFFGARRGYALMALTDADSDLAVSYILRKLGLNELFVPPFTVYPEVLNMLAGHLITELGRYGYAYQINSPSESLPFSPYERHASRTAHVATDQGFSFGFYLYMKETLA